MNETRARLHVVPSDFRDSAFFIKMHHRHHPPARGHKFSLAVADELDAVRGVAVVGRPVSRLLDDGMTLEVTRVATDGCPNACSALYGACRRAVFALGYTRLITYTLQTESGASLRGAGWRCIGEAGGGTWNRKYRPRIDSSPTQKKFRWEVWL